MKALRYRSGITLLALLISGTVMAAPETTAKAVTDTREEHIPEVLRYARDYVRDTPPVRRTAAPESAARRLAQSELVRRQQQARITALEAALQTQQAEQRRLQETESPQMKQIKEKETALAEREASLSRREATLKQREMQAEDQGKAATVARAQIQALDSQVALLEGRNRALQADLATQQGGQEKMQKEVADLRQAQSRQVGDLQAKEAEVRRLTQALAGAATARETLTAQVAALEKERDAVTAKMQAAAAPVSLKTDAARQAYATGVMYARDVREAGDGNRLLGLKTDPAAMLAGLSDALHDRALRMTPAELSAALQAQEAAAEQGYQAVVKAQAQAAEAYLKVFRKQGNAQGSAEGVWSRVSYAGDGPQLTAEDVVDLVVVESLTDGTVISDMEKTGSSLRQRVKDFPPVFAAALESLKNHGQVTLVVPPALAYGEAGFAPSVPPGATMVYKLRVVDVLPRSTQKVKRTQKAPRVQEPEKTAGETKS